MANAAIVEPRRVLIVGDGDLSYSLALQRAFGETIELTATVLPTAEELAATLSRASDKAAARLKLRMCPRPSRLVS